MHPCEFFELEIFGRRNQSSKEFDISVNADRIALRIYKRLAEFTSRVVDIEYYHGSPVAVDPINRTVQ